MKMSNKQKYVIDGKLYGKIPMLFSSAVSLVFLALAVDQLRGGSGKIFTVGLMFSVGFVLSLFVSIPLINRYFSLRYAWARTIFLFAQLRLTKKHINIPRSKTQKQSRKRQ